jgi:hypothetical protein
MSFDSAFDYTTKLSDLNNKIVQANAIISGVDTQISHLANVDAMFTTMANSESTVLNSKKAKYVDLRDTYQDVISEINGVINLSSQDKQILYNFYANIDGNTEPLIKWMNRMPYNTNGLIQHAGNINSQTLTVQQRDSLSNQLCKMYSINRNVIKSNRQPTNPPGIHRI